MPSLFRKGGQDTGDEAEHAPATMTAQPGGNQPGEEQDEAQNASSAPVKAKRTAHAAQPRAGTKVIVVADRGATDGHGEAYAFDSPEDAAEFVRSAVEDGMESSHIHVFIGAEARLNVVFRAEVNLEPPEGAEPV